jgi:hypothetical protein
MPAQPEILSMADTPVFKLLCTVLIWAGAYALIRRFRAQIEIAPMFALAPHISVLTMATLLMLAMIGTPLGAILAIGLFIVSGLLDADTATIPPDAFVYGATIASIFAAAVDRGSAGLLQALCVQALCFGLTVLMIRYTGALAGGDVKLAMQFGAACGSLSLLYTAALGVALAMAGVLVATVAQHSTSSNSATTALRAARTLRLPLGGFLLFGLLAAHGIHALGALP